MKLTQAPDFERLKRVGAADLPRHDYLDARLVRGRGAQTNAAGRFEAERRESFDDGWTEDDEDTAAAAPVTTAHIERARSIISRNDSPDVPFDRSINAYRGCEHGCSYCFARPSHSYLGLSAGLDFEQQIYVKTNAAEVLRRELARPGYQAEPIAMGTNTDPYQPLERTHRITRSILEVMLETRHPVTITTKSALVLRDLDVLSDLAALGLCRVALSITSLDHRLSRTLEPRASTPQRRLDAVRQLAEAGVPVMAMMAPVIPALNDSEIEPIVAAAARMGAYDVRGIFLRLPGEVADIFREWLMRHYPGRFAHVMALTREARGGRNYMARFGERMVGEGPFALLVQQRLDLARKRAGFGPRPAPLRRDLFVPPGASGSQMSLL